MAYDPELALRIRDTFRSLATQDITEKKMFGGLAFLYRGKMTVGIIKDELVVRVMADKMPTVLDQPHTREMDFTKKPMKEFVFVAPQGFEQEQQLLKWIDLGMEHARSKAG
ncbi:TfoX/Sxy family protein [Marinoscillum furvescens]|uniref:TfoX-like protein n=1 Tax=Marinoscillum furvescens DSM 4134 TaxID=1122208 RepID=A0A3D9KXM7_MARFU|nr:TfoX/Sxy family protein [Marinoscillum furvescens]RED92662.1 TfoX-like protein [Marinoscillum furvescens DSM 4134]